MPRGKGSRAQINKALQERGPIKDRSGRATSELKRLAGYEGSDVGFSRLLGAMERDGEITREIRGKRTYSIEYVKDKGARSQRDEGHLIGLENGLNVAGGPSVAKLNGVEFRTGSDVVGDLDYDAFASAVLSRIAKLLQEKPDERKESEWIRRIGELDAANLALQRDLARVTADFEVAKAERDRAVEQLDLAARNIDTLMARVQGSPTKRPTGNRSGIRMTNEDKALFERLLHSVPKGLTKSERVG